MILNPETGEKLEVSTDIAGYIYQINQSKRILKDEKVFSIISSKPEKAGSKAKIEKEAVRVFENSEVEKL